MTLLTALSGLLLAATPAAPSLPDLYVMRHLESRGEGSHARLSEIGANNARRLAAAFGAAPPAAIYVATAQVSLDSAAWLAIERGVTPILFDRADLPGLFARLARERGPVLVVADRLAAAAIVARASGRAPPVIGAAAFGQIWRIGGDTRAVTLIRR